MLSALLLLACAASAQQSEPRPRFYSPTLAVLESEAAKDPASASDLGSARGQAGAGFTGERAAPAAPPVDPSGKTYVMQGATPMPGVTIYTPKEDPTGDGQTGRTGPKPLVSSKLTYGALALGALATIGGLFFAPLLFLGGALLGAGAVLWFIGKKTKPKG